jgi:hypothetical protein
MAEWTPVSVEKYLLDKLAGPYQHSPETITGINRPTVEADPNSPPYASLEDAARTLERRGFIRITKAQPNSFRVQMMPAGFASWEGGSRS